MSLRVWLPLNGDLTNNGLSDVVVTNNGATVDNAGKIGKCYNFTSTYIEYDNPLPTICNQFSICAWVNLISGYTANYGLHIASFGTSYGRICISKDGQAVRVLLNDGTTNYAGGSNALASSLIAGIWNHYAVTFDNGAIRIYINGQLDVERTATITYAKLTSTKARIGTYGAENSKGYVNDLRIYDHALSPKEVKLLSQGLVCHYKLSDRGGDNIIPDTSPNESQYTYPSSGYSDKFSKTSTIVPSASQYVLSFWAKSTHAGDKVRAHWYSPNTTTRAETNQGTTSTSSDGNIDFTLSDNWEKYWCIWTQSSTTAVKHFIFPRMFSQSSGGATGTGTVSVKFVKLEEGDTPTIWKPNKADSYYSYFEYDDKLVYDSSGYNNHAQIWHYDEYGTIVSTSDTTRNSIATYINSENATTNTASGTWMIYGNCGLTTPNTLTVSLWCKPFAGYSGSVIHGLFCLTSNNIGLSAATDYNTSAMHNRDGYIDMCNSSGTHKNPKITIVKNEWHHYAVVYDGRYGKIYRDATELTTIDMGSVDTLKTFTAIVLGYSHAGGVHRKNNSYYSDFRLYATALSQEDIQELYNTPVSITNTGAMLTQGEFMEVTT